MDRQQHYANLDSVLSGTIKPHLIRNAWDETVRVIASIEWRNNVKQVGPFIVPTFVSRFRQVLPETWLRHTARHPSFKRCRA